RATNYVYYESRISNYASFLAARDDRSNRIPKNRSVDVSFTRNREHDDRQVVFGAQGESGHVHDAQLVLDTVVVIELRELDRARVTMGVFVVYSIYVRGLQNCSRLHLQRAQNRGRICAEEWVAG